MPKAFKHTGVLMMLVVVALGLVGAGYALWYQELVLTANVTTGTFDAGWSLHCANAGDCGGAGTNPVVSLDQGHTFLTNNAALFPHNDRVGEKFPTCTASQGALPADEVHDSNDAPIIHTPPGTSDELLTLNLSGLYPYAGCQFLVDLHNDGTVPAHFTVEAYNNEHPTWLSATSTFTDSDSAPTAADDAAICSMFEKVFEPGDHPLAASTTPLQNANGKFVQLHAGEQVRCRIVVYLNQIADAEGATYHITLHLVAHQWNENVTGDPHTGTPATP